MALIKIIAEGVEGSFNNGITISTFEKGETYNVPDFLATAFVSNGRAEYDPSNSEKDSGLASLDFETKEDDVEQMEPQKKRRGRPKRVEDQIETKEISDD